MENSEMLLNDLKEKTDLRKTLSDIRKVMRESSKTEGLSLGNMIMSDDEAVRGIARALDSDDAKARKSAALLIGELPYDPNSRNSHLLSDALVEAYRHETTLFVRESYLKSVKKLGGRSFLHDEDLGYLKERLSEIDGTDFPEEDMKHILSERKLLTDILGDDDEKNPAVFIEPDSFNALLVPVKGLYEPLKEALRDRGIEKGFSAIGAVIRSNDLPRVRDVRLYSHLMYRVQGTFTGEPDKIRKEIADSDFLKFLLRTTRAEDKVSVRIIVHEKKDQRTNAAKRFTGEFLYLYRNRLINRAPYDMALHFYPKKSGGYALFVRAYNERDERFSYVKEKLSTSMQPVKAAIMVYLVRKYLREEARVCDIFAGNGTLLLERDTYLRTRVMFATDTNGDAIAAGRKNAAEKGRTVHFVRRSAFTFESDEPFDEIISELPDLYEIGEDERESFYEKTAQATLALLSQGGIAIYLGAVNGISSMIRKTKGLTFREEIPFDDKRNIFVLERE